MGERRIDHRWRAGAGTAIGAIAGGKKGAAVAATVGGIGGLIYDLTTRQRVALSAFQ
jgi:hypothetical protein